VSKQKKEYSLRRILIIVGVVVIGIGVLLVAFVPDTSGGVEIVNGYGIGLIIIGVLVFVVRYYIRTPQAVEYDENEPFKTLENAGKDFKNAKSKTGKFKVVLWVIASLAVIAIMYLIYS